MECPLLWVYQTKLGTEWNQSCPGNAVDPGIFEETTMSTMRTRQRSGVLKTALLCTFFQESPTFHGSDLSCANNLMRSEAHDIVLRWKRETAELQEIKIACD